MSNYAATIVRISNLRKHNNADRLLCTTIFGNNIIVGLNTKEGDLGIYFPLEAQLGEGFAKANDLVRRKDADGKPAGGMFGDNRRVRCQKFRGEQSMGFWIPIDSLTKAGVDISKLKEGDEFETLGGVEISKKYVAKPQRALIQKQKKERATRLVGNQFRFHFDTSQLGKNLHRITPETLISVSWKLHGTSAVAARVMCKRKLSWYERLAKTLGVQIIEREYDYLFSSRRVVKNDNPSPGHSGYDLWTEAGKRFIGLLRKGETVYYEIVGHTPDGRSIQKGFDYGCGPNEYKIYIYRITMTNIDGDVVELPWHQVRQRADEWGVDTCPHIYEGYAAGLFKIDILKDSWQDEFFNALKRTYVADQDSQFCNNKVPEEGVVIRVEGTSLDSFKLKSFRFMEWETKQLDSGEDDMETKQ